MYDIRRGQQPVLRTLPWKPEETSAEVLVDREWLVTNALGGYSSGTVAGVVTRRYHGILVAALPRPHGRVVMWTHLGEVLHFDFDRRVALGAHEHAGLELELSGASFLHGFRLENGLPVWTYRVEGVVLEKRLLVPHLQNTVHVGYRVLEHDGKTPWLEVRPAFNFRHHESPVDTPIGDSYRFTALDQRFEISNTHGELPPLRLCVHGCENLFTVAAARVHQSIYRVERERGYDHQGELWTPGFFHIEFDGANPATIIGSTETWEVIDALEPAEAFGAEASRRQCLLDQAAPEARDGFPAELVLAADQFVITPAGRTEEAARARAVGDELRTVIAGYHWFTDWGRDTMISLEGLTLSTGRGEEAGYILRTFGHYVQNGLIPNMFPDGEREALYHTADATLWFFHALHRYGRYTNDEATLSGLLPKLQSIVAHHLRGTTFNIRIDPEDGLLAQGAEGYQLTWMDAKMGDWVVTPRRGKAVELNALWYNALRLLESWTRENGDEEEANRYRQHADRARESFNLRFWHDQGGYLFDVIDCDDEHGTVDRSLRPNQIFAISLDYPVLEERRWERVLEVIEQELLTPSGLRSLAPGNPGYKPIYSGDLHSRDGAYHQGTVWGWLIGPFVDAWLKVHPQETKTARRFLEGFQEHLDTAGVGTISEVFDARAPHKPGGCIAQAWSVAEVLRCWIRTA